MEASRAFQTGAPSSRRIWIMVAVVLAALALGIAGAYLANAMSMTSSAAGAPGAKTGVQAPRVGAGGRHYAVRLNSAAKAQVTPEPDGIRLR